MMILGVGLLIVIAIGLGIYFGIFHGKYTVKTGQADEDPSRLLIKLIQTVTQSTKFIE